MLENHSIFTGGRTVTKNSYKLLLLSPNQKDDEYSHNDKKISIKAFDKRQTAYLPKWETEMARGIFQYQAYGRKEYLSTSLAWSNGTP